jgi:hypothetical protein
MFCLRAGDYEEAVPHIGFGCGGTDCGDGGWDVGGVARPKSSVLTNALRHTPSDGTIAVVLDREAAAVRITVEDSGSGLNSETMRRMFDRFWRAGSSRNRTSGGGGASD